MPLESPSSRYKSKIIFGPASSNIHDIPQIGTTLHDYGQDGIKKESFEEVLDHPMSPVSIYAALFKSILQTVFETDSNLLLKVEIEALKKLDNLSAEALYVLIHLTSLGGSDQWYRLSALGCQRELGNGTIAAIDELCGVVNPKVTAEVSHYQVISETSLEGGPSIEGSSNALPVESDLSFLCEDETLMEPEGLLDYSTMPELKALAKEKQTKSAGLTRASLVTALISNFFTQNTLDFSANKKGKAKAKPSHGGHQTTLPFISVKEEGDPARQRKRQKDVMRTMVMKSLVKCVRLNVDFFHLLQRVNILYFRCSQYPNTSIFSSVVSSVLMKTVYPDEQYKRHTDIWKDRETLLMYEEALIFEASIDGGSNDTTSDRIGRARGSKTPAIGHQFATPVTPASAHGAKGLVTPIKTPRMARLRSKSRSATVPGNEELEEDVEKSESLRIQQARKVKRVFEEIYPKWKELLEEAGTAQERSEDQIALERFEVGHVLTRLVERGAQALKVLKEYDSELGILEALLEQKMWRRGRRGRWHERRAAILMKRASESKGGKVKQGIWREALNGTTNALLDKYTGIAYRPSLIRILVTLQEKLGIPEEQRWICPELPEILEVTLEARKKTNSNTAGTGMGPLRLDATGRPILPESDDPAKLYTTPSKADSTKQVYSTPTSAGKINALSLLKAPSSLTAPVTMIQYSKQNMKPSWVGKNGEGVYIQTLALEHYDELGFKGLSSETGAVLLIFHLLFWDIIYDGSIPGSFETPYQYAPLDMSEDTFHFARANRIKQRLEDIDHGGAQNILERNDRVQRPNKPCCAAVDWEICRSEDLVQVIQCLGGRSLSIICTLLLEEYGARSARVPDLVVWNIAEGVCRFVHVMGPKDVLHDDQKVWNDVLLRGGVTVEICNIVEPGQEKKPKTKTKAKAKGKTPTSKKRIKYAEPEPDSDELETASEDELEDQVDELDGDDDPFVPREERKRKDAPPTFAPLNLDMMTTRTGTSASPSKKRRIG